MDERVYKTLATAAGKAKIAAAVESGGVVNVTQAAVGDGGGEYYVPTEDMTALKNEVWRGAIASKWINEDSPNMIDVKMIIPADAGGWTVREAAIFDADGTMICICNLPDTEKVIITTGAAGTLTLVMHLVFTDSDVVNFTIDPVLDVVTAADVDRMIREHNEDQDAHEKRRKVIAERVRDPSKPDYGLDNGETVALEAAPYTGQTEVGVVVSGEEYDAKNLSQKIDSAPSGTIIFKKMEE